MQKMLIDNTSTTSYIVQMHEFSKRREDKLAQRPKGGGNMHGFFHHIFLLLLEQSWIDTPEIYPVFVSTTNLHSYILSVPLYGFSYPNKKRVKPWLVWLSELSTGLQTKGSLVQSPLRAHAWFASQVPGRGRARGNHTLMFLSFFFSHPLCL